MNKLFACLALAFVAPIFGSLYADDEGAPPEQYEPPPPVGMDVDYLAPPKQKLSIGFRVLSGPKVSYSGSGIIPFDTNPAVNANGDRIYDDGQISPDTRIDAVGGAPLQQSSDADGRTNSWSDTNASQVDTTTKLSDGSTAAGVDMHTYSATDDGSNSGSGRAASGAGFELTFERDFGWHLGRVQFDLIGGIGMNKISYSQTVNVAGMMTTTTDVYNTFNTQLDANNDPLNDTQGNQFYGALPAGTTAANYASTGANTTTPGTLPSPSPLAPVNAAPIPTAPGPTSQAPYSAPSSGTDNLGNTIDNSTLIDSNPDATLPDTTTPTQITEKWTILGAYYTMRFGAQMTVPITEKFNAIVSGGPALVYVGTKFRVDQTITPPTGNPISSEVSEDYNTVLPAYFADASIEYTFTDTTGVYLGAVFQSSTGYNQTINEPDGNFTDKVEFGNQEGLRGGISFKF
jgi:hypothetical protein